MNSKRFFKLQIIFLVMLTLTIVSNTYAWSNRPAVKGGGYMSIDNFDGTQYYDRDGWYFTAMSLMNAHDNLNVYFVNGKACTAQTFVGTKSEVTGEITYGTTAVTKLASQNVTEDTMLYFKTMITNGANVDTNTSLFADVKYDSDLEGKYFVGVTEPTRDLMTYPSDSDDSTRTVRWIPVLTQYEVMMNGTAYIEWFVKFEGSGSFEITNIVLTNN